MTRSGWRGRVKPPGLRKACRPGQVVSVDTVESSTPGLVAQLKGRLTTQRYKYATVFVYHHSRYGFVWLHRTNSSEELIQGKHASEAHADTVGVRIQHYHADNGRFADNGFINDAAKQKQTISYCGVSAHHQNGIAEKRIRDLTKSSRKMVLHASS